MDEEKKEMRKERFENDKRITYTSNVSHDTRVNSHLSGCLSRLDPPAKDVGGGAGLLGQYEARTAAYTDDGRKESNGRQ